MSPDAVKDRPARQKPRPERGKKTRKKGSLGQVQARLWAVIERASVLLDDADPVNALKAAHALSTAAGAYARVVGVSRIAERLDALESRLADE